MYGKNELFKISDGFEAKYFRGKIISPPFRSMAGDYFQAGHKMIKTTFIQSEIAILQVLKK